jgi:hypothetical protein
MLEDRLLLEDKVRNIISKHGFIIIKRENDRNGDISEDEIFYLNDDISITLYHYIIYIIQIYMVLIIILKNLKYLM